MLPTEVMSVASVVLGISRRTIGTDSVDRFSNGSDSLFVPSIQARASGPSFRINACKNTEKKFHQVTANLASFSNYSTS